jgi:hypothetical protein
MNGNHHLTTQDWPRHRGQEEEPMNRPTTLWDVEDATDVELPPGTRVTAGTTAHAGTSAAPSRATGQARLQAYCRSRGWHLLDATVAITASMDCLTELRRHGAQVLLLATPADAGTDPAQRDELIRGLAPAGIRILSVPALEAR